MSANHHGKEDERNDLMQRFMDQCNKKAKRHYSQGRISPEDEGDLAIALMADTSRNTIVMRFGKPTEWIGFGPEAAEKLIELLREKIAECLAVHPQTHDVP